MASIIKKTAIVCADVMEFEDLTKFRHKEGVEEYIHVDTLADLETIDILTNAVYLRSAKDLEEFTQIKAAIGAKGVSERWQ
jgi:hypothetical protein